MRKQVIEAAKLHEISLGGSRLNRFMKDVENVTGQMGEGEAVTTATYTPCV